METASEKSTIEEKILEVDPAVREAIIAKFMAEKKKEEEDQKKLGEKEARLAERERDEAESTLKDAQLNVDKMRDQKKKDDEKRKKLLEAEEEQRKRNQSMIEFYRRQIEDHQKKNIEIGANQSTRAREAAVQADALNDAEQVVSKLRDEFYAKETKANQHPFNSRRSFSRYCPMCTADHPLRRAACTACGQSICRLCLLRAVDGAKPNPLACPLCMKEDATFVHLHNDDGDLGVETPEEDPKDPEDPEVIEIQPDSAPAEGSSSQKDVKREAPKENQETEDGPSRPKRACTKLAKPTK